MRKSTIKIMNALRILKSIPHFLSSSIWKSICLFIILGLVCTSSIHPELKSLPGDYDLQSHLKHRDNRLNNLLSNSSEWLICGINSWEDLKTFLPEAKMNGISVRVNLLPPFQSTPICTEGAYSEPFGQDYILWAQEIAKLSLRYSNLIGYGIDDLQENLDLGYLRQTYIDSLITTGKSINPKIQFSSIDATPPSAPSSLTATSGINKITLAWINPTAGDLARIYIYRASTTNPTVLIDSIKANVQNYIDTPLTAGSTYFYRLKARDNSFNYSVYSSNVSATLNNVTDNTTNWYVDRDATGTQSGADWTNAAKTIYYLFSHAAINGGDTIYVSGGSDSTTYYTNSATLDNAIVDKTITGGVVVITKGWEAGHNGDVYFTQQQQATPQNYGFIINNSQNIKLTGLNFNTNVTAGADYTEIIYVDNNSSNIIIDNCSIISDGGANCFRFSGTSKQVTINNCHLEVLANTKGYDQDLLLVNAGAGGHTFTNNTFIHRGTTSATPHNDLMQIVSMGSDDNLETVIANNFFYFNIGSTQGGAGGIFIESPHTNRFLIYNNIIAMDVNQPCILIKTNDLAYNVSARIYNNTLVTGGNTDAPIRLSGNADTVIIKNNIIYNDGGSNWGLSFYPEQLDGISSLAVDYNRYYSNGGTVTFYDSTHQSYTFAQWQALGYDTYGSVGAVSFANIWGTNAADYQLTVGSSCIDKGTPISIFDTDILGVIRPKGVAWDIGALEQ